MSQQGTLRKRTPTKNHRPPNPSFSSNSSSSPRRSRNHQRRVLKPPKPIKALQRCNSEPILWTVGVIVGDENRHSEFDGVLFRPQTCTDIFVSPNYTSGSHTNPETPKYKKDAKVVVNVTVEGSPGPVRTLVKLGASVEETIKLVVDRYGEEGRSPQLGQNAVSLFELHHSHFSLQSISKTDTIGDAGTRSFYLRKSTSGRSSEDDGGSPVSVSSSTTVPLQTPFVFMPPSFARKMGKFGRRMRKLWMILSCNSCGG